MFLPPGTFGSYIFAKAARDAGNRADAAFAETGTLPWLTRKHGPFEVAITIRAKRLPTGVLPLRLKDHALAVIGRAFPGVIEDCGDALSGALMNAGPIIHPPLITMNAAPLEHFERWDIHKEGTQPAMRRVTDALDAERIAVREALGYGAPHFPLADHYAREGEEWMYGRGSHDRLTDSGDWREHIVLTQHRYMLEDVRIGLSFLDLGRRARRRADAARARVPGDRRRGVRRGLSCRPGARWRSLGLGRARPRRAADDARRGLLTMREPIACLGAGRMGRGIAVVFAYAGHQVTLVDFKARDAAAFEKLSGEALGEVRNVLGTLASFGLFDAAHVDGIAARVSVVPERERAGRARHPPASSSKACRRCSTSSARRWRARRSSPGRRRSSPRPRRPSWSTICPAPSRIPSASSTRTGSIRPFSCRWSRSRPASTPIRPSRRA